MKVQRIDHVHIVVKDLEATAKLYSDLFGTHWFGPREPEGPDRFRVAFDNLGIELLQPAGRSAPPPGYGVMGNPIQDYLDKHGEGIFTIGIKVDNLNEAVAELRAKGISVDILTPTDPSYTGDMHVAITTDPTQTSGAQFELLEYQDVHPAAVGN